MSGERAAPRRGGLKREEIVEIVHIVLEEAGSAGLAPDEITWVRARILAETNRAELFRKLRDELAKKGIVALAVLIILAIFYGWSMAWQKVTTP